MRIIGIDPGTAITGFGIVEKNGSKLALLDYGCIRTAAGLEHGERLTQIAADITTLIKKWNPQHACIEKLFFQNNSKTAMTVSEARGVILQKIYEKGISIIELTPLQIKNSICGYGKADKKMVQEMVKTILKLKSVPKPDDAADAIAAAISIAHTLPLHEKIIA